MGKKILKRSLVIGLLMTFVITGNTWAEEVGYNNFELPTITPEVKIDNCEMFGEKSGLAVLTDESNYEFFYLGETNLNSMPNKIVTSGPMEYYGGLAFGLFGGFGLNSNYIDDNNILELKHNLTTKGSIELYGGATNMQNGCSGNRISIIGTKEKNVIIKTVSGSYIQVIGGMTNQGKHGVTASSNEVYLNNVNFQYGKDAYVMIYGAEGRDGHTENNTVVIENTIIVDGEIYGGIAEDRTKYFSKIENMIAHKYNAVENDVILAKGTEINGNVIIAGGYAGIGSKGNADGNTVTIKENSIVAGTVYGGFSESGTANNNIINIKDSANVSNASLFGDKDGSGELNTLNIYLGWVGTIGAAKNFDFIYMYEGSKVNFGEALEAPEVILKGATWNVTQEGNKVGTLKNNNGKIAFGNDGHLDVNKSVSGEVVITEAGKTADDLNTVSQLTTVAAKMGVAESAKESAKAKVVMEAGEVVGKTTGIVAFETKGSGDDTYYHGVVTKVTEEINPANEAISDTGVSMKLHWRAHVDDMNKRMGELRDANGEHGVWTRMVRGESEYKNTKAQYNQYQLGYDEKLSVDKRWIVGAAVTFSDGKAGYGYGSTEDKSTAFAIYGSKLNNDGTFVDLIARYAHLESDVEDRAGKGSYSANGMSVSAEFGKRIQQGNGLWIEPQAELTYGTVDSAEYKIGTKTVEVGDMNSLIGRVGFRIGKDIEKGNFYARASYLYDFEGETENAFRNDTARRSFNEDLGGGWWEVGVGANINLSKATYIYADIEKTFGGEVDTNWQWNLGVRYSF